MAALRRGFRVARSVPEVDISALRCASAAVAERRQAALAIDAAFRDAGFLYVTGHGVDPGLTQVARDLSAAFFALGEADKLKLELRADTAYRGYQPLRMNVTKAVPDLHEGMDFYRDVEPGNLVDIDGIFVPETAAVAPELVGVNQWPEDVASLDEKLQRRTRELLRNAGIGGVQGYREFYNMYVDMMLALGSDIMRGVALGLDLPERYFEKYYDRSFWVLRALRYPLRETLRDASDQGCGEHTDYGCLTLITADATAGLDQCLQVRERESQEWVFVPPREGRFLVNIGDMLAHWVSGYRSTAHRVLSPHAHGDMTPEQRDRGRISIAFFFEPNFDAVIKPLDAAASAPPLVYGEHLQRKVTSNFDHA